MQADLSTVEMSTRIFFGVLIALGLASFHWLERPAEEWLRNRLLERGNP